MKTNKTQPEKNSVEEFLKNIKDVKRRSDTETVYSLMKEITGEKPVMWGSSMIGFGLYHYIGKSREGDWFTVGLSPRSNALTLYGLIHYDERREFLEKLGPHTTGKGCIYIKDLSKIDTLVLREMIKISFEQNNGKSFKY